MREETELSRLVEAASAPDGPLDRRQEAFAQIVRQFQDMAYGCAYAVLGDAHLAEDAAQEAFITAWQELRAVRDPAAFPGWFRRIVLSRCHRLLRRRTSTEPLERATHLRDAGADPHERAVRSELQARVRSALRALPDGERMVTSLYYVGGHTQKEIAAFLELPLTTVQKRLYSARKRLRTRLQAPPLERSLEMVQTDVQEHRPSQDARFARAVQLFNAVALGDAARVEGLLAEDPTLVRERRKGQWGERTPLHAAAAAGHTAIAELLLRHGADPHARDEGDHATPLHWATQNDHLEMCRLLIESGAEVNAGDDLHERGPLGWAVALTDCRPEIAAYLIEQGAHVDIFAAIALDDEARVRQLAANDPEALNARMSRFEDHAYPVHFTVTKERPQMLSLLGSLGADLTVLTTSGLTPLALAAVRNKPEFVEQLRGMGAEPDLIAAVALNETARVDALLSGNPSPEELNLALCVASHLGRAPEVRRLLELGASLSSVGRSDWIRGASPLTLAADGNHPDVARLLVEAGADVNHRDEYPGASPLHFASWHGSTEIAGLLMDRGADATLRDGVWGADPLGWAAENRQEGMVDFFRARGVEVSLSRAAYFNRLDLVRDMLDRDPAIINQLGDYGTALYEAAAHGFVELVGLLLERGADPQLPSRHGDTALARVRKARKGLAYPQDLPAHPEIEALLIERGAAE